MRAAVKGKDRLSTTLIVARDINRLSNRHTVKCNAEWLMMVDHKRRRTHTARGERASARRQQHA
jgi:hypothetical protein